MAAAWRRKDAERNAALLDEAEKVLATGMPEETKRRPRPSIKGKWIGNPFRDIFFRD